MKVANRSCFFHTLRPEKVIKSDLGTDGALHVWIHDGSAAPIVEVAYDRNTDTARVVARHRGLTARSTVWVLNHDLAATSEWVALARAELNENYLAVV